MSEKFLCPTARGMTTLDRSKFRKDIQLLVAKFEDPRLIGDFVKQFKSEILSVPRLKHIVSVGNTKGIILRDDIDDIRTYKTKLSQKALSFIVRNKVDISTYYMTLDYDFWKADDILQAVLPLELLTESPTGYAQAGHIAHMNLRDEFKPYGSLIGQVILDKNHTIRTVVDKLDTISNEFRVFDMNVLAGDHDFIAEQQESGCKFKFDFSKVFWNSRLNTEHERLIQQFKAGEVVCDVFAGVGPFAVPAGKKNVLVLANDLNPESYKFLVENSRTNNVQNLVKGFNMDGREFIRQSPKLLLDWHQRDGEIQKSRVSKKRRLQPNDLKGTPDKTIAQQRIPIPRHITNYVMNLPSTSINFLDEFVGLYSRHANLEHSLKSDEDVEMPTINVHCFEKYSPDEPEPTMEELQRRIHQRIAKKIHFDIPFENLRFHLVRRVSPTKPMFCVSFTLPREVAFKELSSSM